MDYSDFSPLENEDNAETSRLVRGEPHSFSSVVVAQKKKRKIGDICLYLAATHDKDIGKTYLPLWEKPGIRKTDSKSVKRTCIASRRHTGPVIASLKPNFRQLY